MIVTQTARLRLLLESGDGERLVETSRQYAEAFNVAAQEAWDARRINPSEIHKATYPPLRERLDLPSQLVISARMKAIEAVKSAKALKKLGRAVSCPRTAACGVRFDARTYTLDWETRDVRLTLIGGRIQASVRYDRHSERFRGLPTGSAEVIRTKKGWFLHVVVRREVEEPASTGRIVGVDRGVRKPAVTSEGLFLGKSEWRAIEERMLSLRRRLQAKGTRSAKRRSKLLGNRLGRFRRDGDQVLSKRMVESCKPGDTLVFEDLTHIRSHVQVRGKAARRRMHAWSFHRLGGRVEYKAALRGVTVAYVDPRDTSRRCPACERIDPRNRPDQAHFACIHCGFTRNSDLVASWNIRDRHQGLWAPAPRVPGRINGPNAGAPSRAPANPGL
jgi:putative transposase